MKRKKPVGKYDRLKKRARNGSLPRQELERLVPLLQQPETDTFDRLDIIYIVAMSNSIAYRPVLESLLADEDVFVVRRCLNVLSSWGTEKPFGDYLLNFLNGDKDSGRDPDEIEDLFDSAILYAGCWLREHEDVRVVRKLWKIFEGADELEAKVWTYQAMARAVGRTWEAINPFKPMTVEEFDPRVIEQFKSRLG